MAGGSDSAEVLRPLSGERDLRPALTLAAALLISGTLGSVHAFSVFVAPLEDALSASRASVALLYSLALVSLTLGVLLSHRVFRRFAPSIVLAGLGGLACAGLLLAALLPGLVLTAVGYGLLFGFANGLGYALALQLAARAYPRRKGTALGVVTAVYALGAMVFAKLFAVMIEIAGPGPTLAALGIMVLGIALSGAATLRLSGASLSVAPDAAAGPPDSPRRLLPLLWLGYGCGCLAGLMVIGHAAAIVADAGGDQDSMVLGTMLIALGNAVGGVVIGLLADRLPLRGLIVALPLLSAAALLALQAGADAASAIAALVVIGFAYGAIIAVYPAVTVAYVGLAQSARAYGRIFTAWGLAGLAGPFVAGAVYDANGSYGPAVLMAAGLAGLSALAAGFLPRAA